MWGLAASICAATAAALAGEPYTEPLMFAAAADPDSWCHDNNCKQLREERNQKKRSDAQKDWQDDRTDRREDRIERATEWVAGRTERRIGRLEGEKLKQYEERMAAERAEAEALAASDLANEKRQARKTAGDSPWDFHSPERDAARAQRKRIAKRDERKERQAAKEAAAAKKAVQEKHARQQAARDAWMQEKKERFGAFVSGSKGRRDERQVRETEMEHAAWMEARKERRELRAPPPTDDEILAQRAARGQGGDADGPRSARTERAEALELLGAESAAEPSVPSFDDDSISAEESQAIKSSVMASTMAMARGRTDTRTLKETREVRKGELKHEAYQQRVRQANSVVHRLSHSARDMPNAKGFQLSSSSSSPSYPTITDGGSSNLARDLEAVRASVKELAGRESSWLSRDHQAGMKGVRQHFDQTMADGDAQLAELEAAGLDMEH